VVVTRPGVGQGAVLSVTRTSRLSKDQKSESVTLRRTPPELDPHIVPDAKWPAMFRLRLRDGSLGDMVNLPRAKDALAVLCDESKA